LFSATFQKTSRNGHGHFAPTVHVGNPGKNDRGCYYQKVYPVRKKTELIIKLITEGNWKQILVSPVPNKNK
jgi:ATP-dependent RNA helicase RhlE